MAQVERILDVNVSDLATALNDHIRGCVECRGSDMLCRTGEREFNAFSRAYMDERRAQINAVNAMARATACAPYARRMVVTARVS